MILNVRVWTFLNLGERSWTWANVPELEHELEHELERSERSRRFMNNVHEWTFEWAVLYDVVHNRHFFLKHNNLVSKTQKSGGTHALFEKDSCLSLSEWVCEIVKLSGFERPKKLI